MLTTTLRELRAVPACETGIGRLIASLGGFDARPIVLYAGIKRGETP